MNDPRYGYGYPGTSIMGTGLGVLDLVQGTGMGSSMGTTTLLQNDPHFDPG